MLELEIYVGEQGDWVLQIPFRDGTAATTFLSTDALVLSVWEGQQEPAIISTTVDWYEAVTALTLTAGGTNYSSSATVAINGGTAGNTATAYPVITGGVITALTLTSGGDGYTSTPTVDFTDGTGTGATATATVTLGWQTGLVAAQIIADDSALLSPGGVYRFQITATRDALTSVVVDCLLRAISIPGDVTPSPPDLATYDFVEALLSDAGLTATQRAMLPYLVTAASMAIRRECKDRNFDLRTYTQFCDVELDGTVRLYQPPIQQVTRVQGQPGLALTISNTSSSVQAAQALFAYSGTWQGYGSNAQTITGMTLNWVSSGVASTHTFTFTTNQTITDLAGLINAYGSGWSATADSTLGLWPVTELTGGEIGQGCSTTAIPNSGAIFNVLLDLQGFYLDVDRVGILWVGRQYPSTNANRWGPGGYAFFGNENNQCGRVKVTYSGGFSTIPTEIQMQTAELVKWKINILKTDMILESETAQEYSYRLSLKMIAGMPDHVRQAIAPWKLWFA